jgi:methylated-DNA-protein-cysteine methyltransferase-like protein
MSAPIKISDQNKDFFQRVYQVVALIPEGRATSYGAIGKYLGSAKSARMVGWAMNSCIKSNPDLPAHRVVNRNGMLSGKMHFGTPTRMAELLSAEGLTIENDTIRNFNKVFWDPTVELAL